MVDRSVVGSFVGSKVSEHRGAFRLSYPMEHGVVADWKAGEIEKVWAHVYSREQLNVPSEEHPVSEPASHHNTDR